MLENNSTSNNQQQRLFYPPYQYFYHHSQISRNKEKILASLQQMGVEVNKIKDKPMGEILKEADDQLRRSYTVKVVAVKDGEIGVLSKRIEMKMANQKKSEDIVVTKSLDAKSSDYVINNYFYPKCLKSIKRQIDPKDDEQKQKLLRWQAEQYERLKGRATDTLLPDLDDDEMKPFQDTKVHSNKLIIAGLGALRSRDKNYILPQVKRFQTGQNKSKEALIESRLEIVKNDNKNDHYVLVNQEIKKLSYSRLLADLTERDLQMPLQKLMIYNTGGSNVPNHTNAKPGGVIYELEEEHENSPTINNQKLPSIAKKVSRQDFPKSESDNFQKRLKKFQDKLQDTEDKQ